MIPAFVSVAIIVFGVREPERPPDLRKVRAPLSRAELARLEPALLDGRRRGRRSSRWRASAKPSCCCARSRSGLPLALVPMVMVVMNVVYTLSAWPAGALSDRIGRYGVVDRADLRC